MAVDAALLESGAATACPVLRYYAWEPATVSLGYFQALADRQSHTESVACPVVRRTTGGGAIVHDVEITYSLVVADPRRDVGRHKAAYESVHRNLIALFRDCFRLDARWHPGVRAVAGEPFLCFQRRAPGDVVAGDAKVVGSAQRRRGGALLQHGSILLRASRFAPTLRGLHDLMPNAPPRLDDIVRCELAERLARQWCVTWEMCELTQEESRRAASIEENVFAADRWTHKR
jgi:lipoate-protein ligase A